MSDAPKAAAPAPSSKKLPLIIVAVVIVAASGAGGWMFHRRGAAAAQQADPPKTASEQVKSVLHLENFIVNLQGGGDTGYLRLGVDLGLAAELKEDEKSASPVPRLRDVILTVLGSRTVDELMTPDGKAKLKQDVLQAINEHIPEIQCKEVYFTEFLVQH